MRILHTADWHLGRTLEGRSRLEEQAAFLDELVEIVNDQQIDLVLLAGDVYDTVNPPAAAEQLFYDGVSRLADGGKRPILVIAGNHDNPDRLAASWPLAWQQGIQLVGLPTASSLQVDVRRTGERAIVCALPYPSESRLKELLTDSMDESVLRSAYSERVGHLLCLQAAAFSAQTVNLAMSHVYVMGGAESDSERPIQVGGAYTVDTAAFCIGAQYTALGHLHRPQTIKAPELIRYSGSPLSYSFSEANQAKSVTVLDVHPEGIPEMTELFLRSGKPLVKWHAKEGMEQVQRWLDEGRDAQAWIDLELYMTTTPTMEQIHSLRKLHPGIVNIRPIYPEMEKELVEVTTTKLPIDELFTRFYVKQTGGAQPEPALLQLFLELIREQSEGESA